MSQENVEILAAGFAGFESGQFFKVLDPKIVWEARPDLPDFGSCCELPTSGSEGPRYDY